MRSERKKQIYLHFPEPQAPSILAPLRQFSTLNSQFSTLHCLQAPIARLILGLNLIGNSRVQVPEKSKA